jgi:chromosome segregation ATPase
MQSGQILNLEPELSRKVEDHTPGLGDELTQTQELLEDARSEIRRTQTELHRQQDEQESQEKRTKILSIILGLLIVCFAGAVWWMYPTLRDQKRVFADMFAVQTVTNTLGERMNSVEVNLSKAVSGLPALSNRMDQLQASMKTNLQIVRNQAQAAATQAGQRIREDVNRSMQVIQSRLVALESNQKEASEHVNQLQAEVAGLRRELVAVRQDNSAATERIKELNDAQQTDRSDVSGLSERVASGQTAFNTLTNRLDRKRVDFEAHNRRTEQIAPGIYLALTRTDPVKREIEGTLLTSTNDRSLAIRGQGVQKPLTFYLAGESRPVELVVTQVSNDKISGYLMVPAPMESASR